MEEADAPPADTRSERPDWLELPASASCGIGAKPFQFRHRLTEHAAFTTDALLRLSESAPRAWVVCRDADLPLVSPRGSALDHRPPGEVMRGLADSRTWVLVRHLEHIAPYSTLLDEFLAAAAHTVDPDEGRTVDRGAITFAASPGAVVPVHIDRHHNFLLQITGTKEFGVGHFSKPSMQARELARNFGPAPSNPHRVPDRQTMFQLGPGDGVYIPANTFHWVSGGSETSVAFSCAFRTERTDTAELVNEFDASLQRLRLPFRTPSGPTVDRVKAAVVRRMQQLREQRRSRS